MKKTITLILLITNAAFAFTSCMAPKPLASKLNLEQKKGRDISNEIFVVKRDGEKITGKKITSNHASWLLHTAFPKKETIAIDGQTMNYADYELVQTGKAYRRLYYPENNEKESKGIYINRLRFGRLNLYHYESQAPRKYNYQSVRFRSEYVFQIGHGKLCPLNYNSFENAIGDNKKALAKLAELFPTGSIPKTNEENILNCLLEITEIYNNDFRNGNMNAGNF